MTSDYNHDRIMDISFTTPRHATIFNTGVLAAGVISIAVIDVAGIRSVLRRLGAADKATAAGAKCVETMRYLIRRGADLTARSDADANVLHMRRTESGAVRFLLDFE